MQVSSDFLSVIPQLCQASHLSPVEFIEGHTILPFYRPFISRQEYKRLTACLAAKNSCQVISLLSLAANRIISEPCFKCCATCIRDDMAKHGVGYWHCTHQLPGISCCTQHAVALKKYRKGRKKLISPPNFSTTERIDTSSAAFRYAALLTDCFHDSNVHLIRERLYNTYYRGLADKSLLTECNHIRMSSLKNALYNHWWGLFRHDLLNRVNPIDKHRYPECLFYSQESTHHPIKHLLLIGYLFGSWKIFINQYHENNDFKQAVQQSKTKIDPLAGQKQLARCLLHQGKSLRSVSSESGLSVTSLGCIAEQENVKIRTRPKSIYSHERRAIWRKLMFGESTQSIAKRFGVSVGSIELILRAHHYLIPLRKKIWFYKSLRQHQQVITDKLHENPSIRRVDIQRECKRSYTWLYRHDTKWLYNALPPEIPRQERFIRKSRKLERF